MKRTSLLLGILAACVRGPSILAAPQEDFAKKWKASWEKAAAWLTLQQSAEDGSWGKVVRDRRHPSVALTALSVYALAVLPPDLKEKFKPNLDRGLAYLLKAQNPDDGGFAEPPGQLRTYVTSIAITVLAAVDKDKYKDSIDKAVRFIRATQATEGFWKGGHGYGEVEFKTKEGKPQPVKSESSNVSTTAYAADAMHEAGIPQDDEYWKGIVDFLTRCQNSSETNVDPEWLKALEEQGFKVGNDGGFYYKPDPAAANNYGGTTTEADGKKIINSYGSMTYEALKTYIYAGLGKDDPRVKAAVEWCRKNYTVERHPGFPFEQGKPAAERKDNQGIFYYYVAMAKALDAWGEHPFVTADGQKHDWPRELAERLVAIQKADGSWVNAASRWWEGDPGICTPYVMKVFGILRKYFEK